MSESGSEEYASADEIEDEELTAATQSSRNAAAATSGNEESFWEIDGEGDDIIDISAPIGTCDLTADDAMAGVNLFMNNRFVESERFFERAKDHIPVFSLAYGVMRAIKAVMTFEQEDIRGALRQLQHAEKFASKFSGYDGMVKGVAKKILFMRKQQLTAEQLSARVVMSEARLAAAMLQMLDESMMGFVQAGLGIRRAWKGFEECRKVLESNNCPAISSSDRGGVQYGIGAFNLVIALLPPRVLRMVEMMGFSGDKDIGLAELEKCLQSRGLRWPVAAMLLLAYHAILPSFLSIPQQLEQHIRESDKILATCLENYPEGCLFQFILGRQMRLKRDLAQSSIAFSRSMESQREWIQLQHINMYELAWNFMFNLDWASACPLWQTLLRDNQWSKAFFAYMAGVCFAQQEDFENAIAHFSQCAPHVKRRINGKIVSAEQFVLRKIADYSLDSDQGVRSVGAFISGIELTFLWNGYSLMSQESLRRVLEVTETAQSRFCFPNLVSDSNAVCTLLRGTALKWLGDLKGAESALASVADLGDSLTHDVFAVPHALYELGVMLINDPSRSSEAKKYLKQAQKFSKDYNFEMRLRFRLHAASKLANLTPD